MSWPTQVFLIRANPYCGEGSCLGQRQLELVCTGDPYSHQRSARATPPSQGDIKMGSLLFICGSSCYFVSYKASCCIFLVFSTCSTGVSIWVSHLAGDPWARMFSAALALPIEVGDTLSVIWCMFFWYMFSLCKACMFCVWCFIYKYSFALCILTAWTLVYAMGRGRRCHTY